MNCGYSKPLQKLYCSK